ncbi:MAG TPA: GntR family transcriptional regulator [Devosia sp.]|nr:GntR family transcriptional regulator [Devosia sp.]
MLHAVRSEQEDLHLLVSRQIVAAILSGAYPEGSILPNEETLSRDLGVSRTALRESVKGLVAKGILETRRRRGTLVLARQRWNLFDSDIIAWLRREDGHSVTGNLLGTLAIVVPGAIELAASHRNAARLKNTALCAGDASLDSRAAFLLELASAADNAFVAAIISTSITSLLADEPHELDAWTGWLTPRHAAELTGLIGKGDLSAADFARSDRQKASAIG